MLTRTFGGPTGAPSSSLEVGAARRHARKFIRECGTLCVPRSSRYIRDSSKSRAKLEDRREQPLEVRTPRKSRSRICRLARLAAGETAFNKGSLATERKLAHWWLDS